MAPEMKPLGAPSLEDSRWARFVSMLHTKADTAVEFLDSAVEFNGNKVVTVFHMRKNKDDWAIEFVGNKAGSGLEKSASGSDFDTKPAGNTPASASSIEAAEAEDKDKQTAVEAEDKAKQTPTPGSGIKVLRVTVPVNYMDFVLARVAGPEPKVVEVKTEMVSEDDILILKEKPLRRPTPTVFPEHYYERHPGVRESLQASFARINSFIDVQEDILRQYEEKGHAVVGIRVMDNGMRTCFILPEEATT